MEFPTGATTSRVGLLPNQFGSNLERIMKNLLSPLLGGLLLLSTASIVVGGCGKSSEALLKEQSDLVCACTTFDCGMKVLKGPINQELKTRKGKLSDEGRKEKGRMMKCLLSLKAKEVK